MSVEVPVSPGKDTVNITISVMSSRNERVTITSASGNYTQVWTGTAAGTGNETIANVNLPRTTEEKYKVQIDNAVGKAEWQPSRVEINHPELSTHIGTYYVLGYDDSTPTEPAVAVVFTWYIE